MNSTGEGFMKKENISKNGFTLIGISARTNNKNEMNSATGKIGALVNSYFSNQFSDKFNHRANPGVTYIAYTDYESDEHGEYTVFIGEEVLSLNDQDLSQFTQLDIPESRYQIFTTKAGKLPEIVIAAWQTIWQLTPSDLGGKRKYHADFEIYDHRAVDPHNAVVDICIGVDDL